MSTNKKQKKSKYTLDFVPVKSITNGMIILDNNEKVTGVKIMPRNLFILDYSTQGAIIDNLKNVYNQIEYEFWIIAADRPVDINVYLSQLQLLFNSTQDQVRRKLIIEDINKANMFMTNNIVDTESINSSLSSAIFSYIDLSIISLFSHKRINKSPNHH